MVSAEWETGMSMKTEFVYASPEDMGIPSQAIRNFLERLENHKLPMHSFLLMRHGKVLSETYYEPYSADIPHRMFSITKSFTSLAIGFLEDEGKLSLDDKIVGFFPEKQPEGGADPLIAKTTVRDMLRMASPHDKTTYKQIEIDDWVKTFFIAEPKHLPGAFFAYDTSATHTLTALVEKLTGQSLLDYLRCKFLDEIGFSKDAYALKDPMGITIGGSGLVCTPKDLLKVMKVIADGGVYNGKQLIPAKYLAMATSKQISTDAKGATYEELFGYGYQFWMTRHGGYACYGMGGQYAVYLPKKDIIYITTADTQGVKGGTQLIYDAFFDEIYDKASDEKLPPLSDSDKKAFEEFNNSRKLAALQGVCGENMASYVNGITYKIADNKNNFEAFKLSFDNKCGSAEVIFKDRRYEFRFGIGYNEIGKFTGEDGYKTAVCGAWVDRNTFLVNAQLIDECVGSIMLQFTFKDECATVMFIKYIEKEFSEFEGSFYGTKMQ